MRQIFSETHIAGVDQETPSESDTEMKKKKKEKKRKRDKGEKKKSKKSKKRRKKASSDESDADSSGEEQWVEVTSKFDFFPFHSENGRLILSEEVLEQQQTAKMEEDAAIIGPQLPTVQNKPGEPVNPAMYVGASLCFLLLS